MARNHPKRIVVVAALVLAASPLFAGGCKAEEKSPCAAPAGDENILACQLVVDGQKGKFQHVISYTEAQQLVDAFKRLKALVAPAQSGTLTESDRKAQLKPIDTTCLNITGLKCASLFFEAH